MYTAFDSHLSTILGTWSAAMPFKVRGRNDAEVALAIGRYALLISAHPPLSEGHVGLDPAAHLERHHGGPGTAGGGEM